MRRSFIRSLIRKKRNRQPVRRLSVEPLEVRRVLTAWHNDGAPGDVNELDGVNPVDALLVINELNNRVYSDSATGALPETKPDDAPFLDVENNGIVGPVDALLVINQLGEVSTRNVFTISENAIDGFRIGSVEPSGGSNSNSIFEFAKDASLTATERSILELKPGDHLQGSADAPILLIEYVDFACPVCGLFHPLYKQALQDFDGEIAIVTRHFPLTQIHPNAGLAAIAAEAAGRQGAFDEMADMLFERRTTTDWDSSANPNTIFRQFAEELNLNLTQFDADLADPAVATTVGNSFAEARELDFTGTPSLALNDDITTSNPMASQEAVTQMFQTALDGVQTPFKINRYTGEIRVRDSALLNSSATPSYTLDVMVNGQIETVTINVV